MGDLQANGLHWRSGVTENEDEMWGAHSILRDTSGRIDKASNLERGTAAVRLCVLSVEHDYLRTKKFYAPKSAEY